LLEESKIKKLVVTIDDVDRCLPDTIIETLEAVKRFVCEAIIERLCWIRFS
jgi:predicted KAP-like P-loop ATPase